MGAMVENEMLEESTHKIAESTLLTAVARVSMALALPVMGFLFWLYAGWQDEKFDTVRMQVDTVKLQVAEVQVATRSASQKASDVSDRLIAVETKQEQDARAGARFQAEMLARMDRMQDAIIGLSNSVSALTATVNALAENQRNNRKPP